MEEAKIVGDILERIAVDHENRIGHALPTFLFAPPGPAALFTLCRIRAWMTRGNARRLNVACLPVAGQRRGPLRSHGPLLLALWIAIMSTPRCSTQCCSTR